MNQKCEDLRCFGNVNGNCAVLNSPNYAAGKCPFFKTPEQLEQEQIKSNAKNLKKFGVTVPPKV